MLFAQMLRIIKNNKKHYSYKKKCALQNFFCHRAVICMHVVVVKGNFDAIFKFIAAKILMVSWESFFARIQSISKNCARYCILLHNRCY